MEENENYCLMLDNYSLKIDQEIQAIASLRNTIYSIMSYEQFLNEKAMIIQSLFETESILRDSCSFIRKSFIKIKQILQLNNIVKESNIPIIESINSNVFSNFIQIDDNHKYKSYNDDNEHNYNQPITIQGTDEMIFIEQSNNKTDSIAKGSHQTVQSYPLNTEKDHIIDSNNKFNKESHLCESLNNADNDNESNKPAGANYKIESSHDPINYLYENNSIKSIEKIKDNQKPPNRYITNSAQSQSDLLLSSQTSNNTKPVCIKINQPTCHINTSTIESASTEQKKLTDSVNYHSDSKNTLLFNNSYKINASKVSNILMKLNTNEILFNIIVKLFGYDIFDKLMEIPPNEDLIKGVEKSIEELERLEKEDKQKEFHNDNISKKYMSIIIKASNESLQRNQNKKNNHSWSIYYERNSNRVLHDSLNLTMTKKITYADSLLAYARSKQRKTVTHNNDNSYHAKSFSSNHLDISSTNAKYKLPIKSNKCSLRIKKSIPMIELAKTKKFNQHSIKKSIPSAKYLNVK